MRAAGRRLPLLRSSRPVLLRMVRWGSLLRELSFFVFLFNNSRRHVVSLSGPFSSLLFPLSRSLVLAAPAFIVALIAANSYARAIGNSVIWRPEREGWLVDWIRTHTPKRLRSSNRLLSFFHSGLRFSGIEWPSLKATWYISCLTT